MALSGSNPRIDFRQVTEDRLVEVVALLDYRPHIAAMSGGHCNASASLSDYVIHPRVCRGLVLSE